MHVISQPIPKLLPQFLRQYVGNPRLFKFLAPLERFRVIAYLNNVYCTAPLALWCISGAALHGIFTGNPPVEQLDIRSSIALTSCSIVWACYATMICPRVAMLIIVNTLNSCLNGYTLLRILRHKLCAQIVAVKAHTT